MPNPLSSTLSTRVFHALEKKNNDAKVSIRADLIRGKQEDFTQIRSRRDAACVYI
jgi:hypothetical protein